MSADLHAQIFAYASASADLKILASDTSLQHDTPIKTIWKKIKSFKSNYIQQTYHLIKSNVMITDPKEKANALAEYFTNNSRTRIHWIPGDVENMIEGAKLYQGNEEYNKRIGFSELEEALANCKDTSPGGDHISYFLLRSLPRSRKIELLNIFNQSFYLGQVPSAWKTGIVAPILKPGKGPGNVASYRPITLLSCFGNVIEQIIKNRLEYVVEIKRLLKLELPEQFGFRKGQGTTDILVRLEHRIQKTLESRNISMVVYLDLRIAFYMICGRGLIYKLVKSGISGNMIKWLDNYFESRKIQVRLDGHFFVKWTFWLVHPRE